MAPTQAGTILVIALAVALLLIAGIWGVIYWRRRRGNLQRLLRTVGGEVLVNRFIPDGTGEEIHIDHLLLTPYGLILFDVKDVQGMVFAGDRMDVWSATRDGVRITFDNPIPGLQTRAAALALLAPGVPIEARVMFVNDVEFPKGHPAMVATAASFIDEYRAWIQNAPAADFDEAWQAIKAAAS